MKKYPGGGWPEKVDQKIALIAKQQKQPKPAYIQVIGLDLDLLRLAVKTGRMPAITWGGNHMVSLVHASSGGYWAILDNNVPRKTIWVTERRFRTMYTRGRPWAVVLLNPGPPPDLTP